LNAPQEKHKKTAVQENRTSLPSPLFFVGLLAFLLLLSCQSMPTFMPERDGASFIPIEAGAMAYIFVDVKEARPIVNSLNFRGISIGEDKQFQQILDMTDSAIAAVYSEGARSRFRLITHGSYPSGLASIGLGASSDWISQRSRYSRRDKFWHSPVAMMSVAVSPNQAIIATTLQQDIPADPFFVEYGTRVPEGFEDFRAKGVISCWLENPREFINQKLREMNVRVEIPAEQFFINIVPAADSGGEKSYTANIQLRVANPLLARNLSIALFVARSMISPAAGNNAAAMVASAMLANPVTATGNYLNIKTNPMSIGEITQLLSGFSM